MTSFADTMVMQGGEDNRERSFSNGKAQANHQKDRNKGQKPETVVGPDGSAKRNILRKSSDVDKGKKQGGGKKGMWGAIDDGTLNVDFGGDDPNYDSANDDYILVSEGLTDGPSHTMYDPETKRMIVGPLLTLSEFKRQIIDVLDEYFLSEDLIEVEERILDLKSPEYHYELVKRAISMSLDKREREKELVSKMLSALYPKVLKTSEIAKGFERLFEMADDLCLDAPSAPKDLAAYLARAVVDEILPPSFLSDPFVAGLGGEIVFSAKRLLSRDHVGARIERVWGPGDGRSVPELKVAIDQLLEEYLMSRQLDEASHCVKELSVPHFHHEIVKRAVTISLSKLDDDRTAISSLLAFLYANEVVSEEQMQKVFNRLYGIIDDLSLDAPNAGKYVEAFVATAKQDGCLPSSYVPFPDRTSCALNPENGFDEDES